MAEELMQETEKNQLQQQVKNQQLAIAKSMNINPDILKVLETIEEWHIREWLYICAVDGMNSEQIEGLCQLPTVGKIKKARLDYWRSLCVGTDILQKNLEKLQTEVIEVCEESRQARAAIENGLEDALKREAAAQAETIHAKDELNDVLKSRIQSLEEQLHNLKQHPAEVEPKVHVQIAEVPPQTVQDDAAEVKKKSRTNGFFSQILQGIDTKKFIDRYIKDGKMSHEQTEFLLDCLEEGISPKRIETFASPELSVDVMRRLKNLKEKGE